MGGEHSGCDETTRDVLIESALWDPANIAQTGRKLGIVTDARYRFERGVDPEFCVPGCDLATELVLSICGGEPSRIVVAGDPSPPRRSIRFPLQRGASGCIGVDIPRERGRGDPGAPRLWRRGAATVVVPSWRPDIQVKADIVEQIVRIAGVDRAPTRPLPRLDDGVAKPVLTLLQKRTRLAKRTLAALGAARGGDLVVHLQSRRRNCSAAARRRWRSPIRSPPIFPTCARASFPASSPPPSATRGAACAMSALFEVGQVFLGDGENDQRIAAAAVRRGRAKADGEGRHWSGGGARRRLRRQARRDGVARGARRAPERGRRSSPAARRSCIPAARRRCNSGRRPSSAGSAQLHPSALEALDAEGPLVAFEIILDAIPAPKARPTKAKPKLERSEFMPVERDLAFVVDAAVRAGDIVKAARERRTRARRQESASSTSIRGTVCQRARNQSPST